MKLRIIRPTFNFTVTILLLISLVITNVVCKKEVIIVETPPKQTQEEKNFVVQVKLHRWIVNNVTYAQFNSIDGHIGYNWNTSIDLDQQDELRSAAFTIDGDTYTLQMKGGHINGDLRYLQTLIPIPISGLKSATKDAKNGLIFMFARGYTNLYITIIETSPEGKKLSEKNYTFYPEP